MAFGKREPRLASAVVFTGMILGLMGGFGCSRPSARNEIIVAGSTSVQPFADRWAESYSKKKNGVFINVQGGGSSAGIQAALSGAADIGMSSRELKPDEKTLHEIVVARDGTGGHRSF